MAYPINGSKTSGGPQWWAYVHEIYASEYNFNDQYRYRYNPAPPQTYVAYEKFSVLENMLEDDVRNLMHQDIRTQDDYTKALWRSVTSRIRAQHGGSNPYGNDTLDDGLINHAAFAADYQQVWSVIGFRVKEWSGNTFNWIPNRRDSHNGLDDATEQYVAIYIRDAQARRDAIEAARLAEERRRLAEEQRNRLRTKKGRFARKNQGNAGARLAGRRGISSNMLTGPAGSQARAAGKPSTLGGNSFLGH